MTTESLYDRWASLYDQPRTSRRTAKFLASNSEARIRRALRHYDDDPIVDQDEIAVRDNLDVVLASAGVAEIFSEIEGSTDWLDRGALNALGEVLTDPHVRKYYEKTFPLVLPQLFRQRIEGERSGERAGAMSPEERAAVQIGIVDLEGRANCNKPLSAFLDLLDGYNFRDWFIEDALERLSNPELVAKKTAEYLEGDRRRNPGKLMTVILGFDSFVLFAQDLLRMLERYRDQRIAALIWLHYSYFYGSSQANILEVNKSIKKVLRHWADKDQTEVMEQRISEIRNVFDKLADEKRWLAHAPRLVHRLWLS